MLWTVLASFVLVALTILIHYEVLRGLKDWLPRLHVPSRPRLILAVIIVFVTHIIEICVYGLGYFFLTAYFDLGTFNGVPEITLQSCFYFSVETYTSLGFGDVTPAGDIRLLAGIEALNGLLLIAWSASFIYLLMEHSWTVKTMKDPK